MRTLIPKIAGRGLVAGGWPQGHEPGPAWRQLEQRRQELPVGEPQQEQSREPEPEQRVPRGRSSANPVDAGPTDPAAFPSRRGLPWRAKPNLGRPVLVGWTHAERSGRPFHVAQRPNWPSLLFRFRPETPSRTKSRPWPQRLGQALIVTLQIAVSASHGPGGWWAKPRRRVKIT